MQQYVPLKPNEDGTPQGRGYKCGACGLEGLAHGEPHVSSAGRVCEPPVTEELPSNHPQAEFVGKPLVARAVPGTGELVRDDLPPEPPPEPTVNYGQEPDPNESPFVEA